MAKWGSHFQCDNLGILCIPASPNNYSSIFIGLLSIFFRQLFFNHQRFAIPNISHDISHASFRSLAARYKDQDSKSKPHLIYPGWRQERKRPSLASQEGDQRQSQPPSNLPLRQARSPRTSQHLHGKFSSDAAYAACPVVTKCPTAGPERRTTRHSRGFGTRPLRGTKRTPDSKPRSKASYRPTSQP